MTAVRVSYNLIRHATTNRNIKAVACFYMLKAHFTNGRIYNYRNRLSSLAAIPAISDKTFLKYVTILQNAGLVWTANNHLFLASSNHLKNVFNDKRKSIITIDDTDNLQEVAARLYCKILEAHARSMAFADAVDTLRNSNKSRLSETGESYSIGIRTMAALFNLDKTTAGRMLKIMRRLNLIQSEPGKRYVKPGPAKAIRSLGDIPLYKFHTTDGIVLMQADCHRFIQFPVRKPKSKTVWKKIGQYRKAG